MTQKKVCAVVGVGPGNGTALAQRFADEGHRFQRAVNAVAVEDTAGRADGTVKWHRALLALAGRAVLLHRPAVGRNIGCVPRLEENINGLTGAL